MEEEHGDLFDYHVKLMMEKAYEYQLNLIELFKDENTACFIKQIKDKGITNNKLLISHLRKSLELSVDKQKNEFKRADELLEYIREKLYHMGVYVFKDSFKADNISGLCLYHDHYPVILLNNKTTFTRQVFTLFHEIYHLYKKEVDVCLLNTNLEKECDKFAGEFLIPTEDFRQTVSKIKDFEQQELINQLASTYKVSPEAVAYKLKQLGKISNDFYRSIRNDGIRKMNSATSGGNFYYTRMSYLGKPYLKQVFTKYYNGKISTHTVGKYTGLKTAYVSRLSSNMFGGAL